MPHAPVAASLIVLSLLATPDARQSRFDHEAALDLRVVAEALEWGRTGEPEPYAIRVRGYGVIGAYVYTPFVRVAMAARTARTAGRVLRTEDVPAWLIEPLTYFAIRWYCAGDECRDPGFSPTGPPVPHVVIVPASRLPLDPTAVGATWVSRDLSILERFGATLPASDVGVIAAFPLELVREGYDVFAFRLREGNGQRRWHYRGGRLLAKDLANWR